MVTPPQCWSSSIRRGARCSRAASPRSSRMARAWARNSSAISRSSVVPFVAHRVLADFGGENVETRQEFFHLHQVIGERLGGGVDGGQAAADHHHRQAQLQIGGESALAAPVSCSAIRKSDAARTPRARPLGISTRWVCPRPCTARHDRTRAAASLRTVKVPPNRTPPAMANCDAALQQQADDLEEILVPADGDAIFGDAAEPSHHAIVQGIDQAR